jgi:hypothetical protein
VNDVALSPLQVSPVGQPIEPPLPEAQDLWQAITVEIDGEKTTGRPVVEFVLTCGLQNFMEDSALVGKDPGEAPVRTRIWMFALSPEKYVEVPITIQVGDHEPCLS